MCDPKKIFARFARNFIYSPPAQRHLLTPLVLTLPEVMINVGRTMERHHKINNRELCTALLVAKKLHVASSGYVTGLWIGWKFYMTVTMYDIMTVASTIIVSS